MKRFLIAAAVVGMLAGLGAQAWGQSYCFYAPGNCWPMPTNDDCEWGTLVNDCSNPGFTQEYCNYGPCVGEGVDEYSCADGGCYPLAGGATTCATGGTKVTECPAGTLPPGSGGSGGGGGDGGGGTNDGECHGYCKWDACTAINPDPTGLYGDPIPDCETANANCLRNSTSHAIYSDAACTSIKEAGSVQFCDAYCKWDGSCEAVNTDPDGEYGTVLATCSEALSNCVSYSDDNATYSSRAACEAGVSVKLLGSKAATPGLRVSYAKNRVIVNWTPAAKVSGGTIQLINAKGAVLSTAFIRGSGGKVTAKLGTVGVPAGMYFVHINAVGQNGQKIVSQSAVSVVK